MSDDRRLHWENVYSTKGEADVSWFQESPAPSLDLIHLVQAKQSDAIVDVGGGASRLVDSFLAEGLGHVTVLDLSAAAQIDCHRINSGDREQVRKHQARWTRANNAHRRVSDPARHVLSFT